jgi:hypothetical protein
MIGDALILLSLPSRRINRRSMETEEEECLAEAGGA